MKTCKYCYGPFVPARKDTQYCTQACGNSYRAKKFRAKTGQTQEFKDRINEFRTGPKQRYVAQKATSKLRGVEFKLSFEEWWKIWEPHWEGRGVGKLVMCRLGDSGPYEVGNVRIDTHQSNMQEWNDIKRTKDD